MNLRRASVWILGLAVAGFTATVVPWEDLTEGDWLYAIATRFALVDGHKVHYPTPTAELAKLLETGQEAGALRHLAEARLALGDRPGALDAMRRWAQREGPQAWAECARWAEAHHESRLALDAAERALPGLPEADRLALADERIKWGEQHPDLVDPITLLQARAQLFPGDGAALERWVRALEKAGRLDEAGRALAGSTALDPERRMLLNADLLAAHGEREAAFKLLDGAVARPWSVEFRKAYALRVDQAAGGAPAQWRATLETRFDAAALVRLATWFQGRNQGGSAADLLRQIDRRYGRSMTRQDLLLDARLYGELDAVPEAFRAALAAAHAGTPAERNGDLAPLAQLALRAGGRPLAWGTYNDEAYRWVANLDRTPGFWTGAVSFLFTGVAWQDTLSRLEDTSVAERTFATARALADTLAQRAPRDPELPRLRVAIMERHVQRGEGQAALALLPQVEGGAPEVADEARRVALLAAQSVPLPRAEEVRLYKARLAHAAPDGSRAPEAIPAYKELLGSALGRMDTLDPSHRAGLDLILSELDRLPDAEALWLDLAGRLEGWNLDDELGPRLQRALERFQDPGIWAKAARWYARRKYQAELRALADEVAARFRGSALFRRAAEAGEVAVALPASGAPGARVRMVLWADLVRLKALERFPHSPEVFRQAERLIPSSAWERTGDPARTATVPVVVPDALVRERGWAVLYADGNVRESWFQDAMKHHSLEGKLQAMEQKTGRTPVDDLLLFEGWSRLSRFERAVAPADRLAACYPGDGALAQRVLSLHRSLNNLASSHAAAARALVQRTAPALEDPSQLWTELGEMAEERGHPDEALALWRNLLDRERDPARIAQLATLLWDYNHDREALTVVEAGRKALGRPRFYAFETGVLRENLHDLEGAVREYLDAVRPDEPDVYASYADRDQRSLRRLAQLLSRERVFQLVAGSIQRLTPGNAADEHSLAAFFPLADIQDPDARTWDDDAWIDYQAMPADPLGRAARSAARESQAPAARDAIGRMGELLLGKVRDMVPRATSARFLDFASEQDGFMQTRWSRDQMLRFQDQVLARRAELAPDEEERVTQEIARAQLLAEHHRVKDADAVWAALAPRIERLPEGTVRIQAEAQRAGYLERTHGVPAAAGHWRQLTARYPWSLGLLEDRLSFLGRCGMNEEGRAVLEQSAAKAGAGYRADLLRRLGQAALDAADLPRARSAAEQLLAQDELSPSDRLQGVYLLARLSFRTDTGGPTAALALAKAQEARLLPEERAELYHQVALAADQEQKPALALWIEALNRRNDAAWITEAARSTRRSGQGPALLAFFQQQRQRSPRDLRWVVAVRDLRRFFHDVPGTLEAAQAAVRLRPDDESLWRSYGEIMQRAGRAREAADALAEWQRPRPADESVARWRSELYAEGSDPAQALAVEQATLAAFSRQAKARSNDLAERQGRAALRLMALGLPEQALRLLSPRGDGAELVRTRLDTSRQVELALLTGQLQRLLEAPGVDANFLTMAGSVVARQARPDQAEAVLARMIQLLYPAQGPDGKALARWWPFITSAGLEPAVRVALAQRLLQSRPGPWQAEPSQILLARVGSELIQRGVRADSAADADPDDPDGETEPEASGEPGQAFQQPDLSRLWCQELARRGLGAQLLAFTEPRWRELVLRVRGNGPVSGQADPLAWSAWLQDEPVLRLWARTLAAQPRLRAELAGLMGERRLWDRFWGLAARRWPAQPLVAALPEGARSQWFRFWEGGAAGTQGADPVVQARLRTVDRVSEALGRLLQGAPGAAADPLLDRLRGPRTVGQVLGQDARWTWAEFAPRRGDQGEALVQGQGADRGRLPGALWGEHPGQAWYVLEALARYRQGDTSAPRVAMLASRSGAQSLMAARLAWALHDLPQALDWAGAEPARDLAGLDLKLSLLVAAQRAPEAGAAFRAHVQGAQATLDEIHFKELALMAGRLGLADPMTCLDPAQPVGPAFLAYLHDARPDLAPRYRPADPASFRIALAQRWNGNAARLTRQQLHTWIWELWANDVAALPETGLDKLGAVWPYALPWLNSRAVPERLAALAALRQDAAPGQAPLLAEMSAPDAPEDWRLLALRLHLSRGESGPARAMLAARLAELRQNWPQTQEPGASQRSLGEILNAWLEPFPAGAEPEASALLAERRQAGPVPAEEWRLAFRLCPAAQAPDLLRDMEEAWFRGELSPSELPGILPDLAALAPTSASAWMGRWPGDPGAGGARQRAQLLVTLKQPAQAAQALLESRAHWAWSLQDESDGFDLWRQAALPGPAPADWQAALDLWRGAPGLSARLKAHPLDLLSARCTLESLAPLAENDAARAELILRRSLPQPEAAALVLRVRQRRWSLSRAQGSAEPDDTDPGSLCANLGARFPAPAIDAALADLARVEARAQRPVQAQAFLAQLAERGAPGLKALATALPAPKVAPDPFRVVDGKPARIRPRDLTWAMLAQILKLEVAS